MVAVDAVLHLARLSVRAGVEARQQGDGRQLVLGRLVPVLKHAGRALAAGPAQVVVVAELVVVFALLDPVQRRRRDLEQRVEAARAGFPVSRQSVAASAKRREEEKATHHGAGFGAGCWRPELADLAWMGNVSTGGGVPFLMTLA